MRDDHTVTPDDVPGPDGTDDATTGVAELAGRRFRPDWSGFAMTAFMWTAYAQSDRSWPIALSAAGVTAVVLVGVVFQLQTWYWVRDIKRSRRRSAQMAAEIAEAKATLADVRARAERPFPFTGHPFTATEFVLHSESSEVLGVATDDAGIVEVELDLGDCEMAYLDVHGNDVLRRSLPGQTQKVPVTRAEQLETRSDIVMQLARWADEHAQVTLTRSVADVHGERYMRTTMTDGRARLDWSHVLPPGS